jgi:hypothetical protein
MENACGALAVIACGWRLKMTTAEGKESEVQEGVCGGWYFVLATEREVKGLWGERLLYGIYHTRLRIDMGSGSGFMG